MAFVIKLIDRKISRKNSFIRYLGFYWTFGVKYYKLNEKELGFIVHKSYWGFFYYKYWIQFKLYKYCANIFFVYIMWIDFNNLKGIALKNNSCVITWLTNNGVLIIVEKR